MGANLEEFKSFVKVHPGLSNVVASKEKNWQEIYEEWTFYKDDSKWNIYRDDSIPIIESKSVPSIESNISSESKEDVKSGSNMEEMMKNALNYVKKINPDTVTKTVTNAQKILALVSGLGIGGAAAAAKNSNTGDPLFDKRFDEWY